MLKESGVCCMGISRVSYLSVSVDASLIESTAGHDPIISGGYPRSLKILKVSIPAVIDPVCEVIAELKGNVVKTP